MSRDDEAPLCRCGCGEVVRSRKHGIWSQWRPGHHRRRPLDPTLPWQGVDAAGVARPLDRVDVGPTGAGQPPVPASVGTLAGQLTLFDVE